MYFKAPLAQINKCKAWWCISEPARGWGDTEKKTKFEMICYNTVWITGQFALCLGLFFLNAVSDVKRMAQVNSGFG